MQTEDVKLTDWARILVGDVPYSFYIELIIRAAFVYLLLIVSMRLIGKRMSSQIGRTEMAALVSLAAAIGVPLQAPDRGLLPAVAIAIVVVFTERWIAARAYKSQNFEKFIQGNIDVLVKDSVMDLKNMKKVRLTRERLVSQLRSNGIKQLGEVKRFYMEANGSFTLIQEETPKPGLSIIPHWDEDFNNRFKKTGEKMVCQTCGLTQKKSDDDKQQCPQCGDCKWTDAVE
ncbi:DUF421 domain-containing protein [Mucilaginibacter robiniae]|uniref:DUF421 domain-containing protein n=1 Tax=Mucilaginibacter robiniae TaxID=2728022 RepID=A0A7L5E1E1_9SPHI|nr:YetF domain-containing protein [Mucilaginibacter robiniae]QJD96851.1 DUF421 domain-containing protein [Mucilaginibacter robiniae]